MVAKTLGRDPHTFLLAPFSSCEFSTFRTTQNQCWQFQIRLTHYHRSDCKSNNSISPERVFYSIHLWRCRNSCVRSLHFRRSLPKYRTILDYLHTQPKGALDYSPDNLDSLYDRFHNLSSILHCKYRSSFGIRQYFMDYPAVQIWDTSRSNRDHRCHWDIGVRPYHQCTAAFQQGKSHLCLFTATQLIVTVVQESLAIISHSYDAIPNCRTRHRVYLRCSKT